MDDTAELDELLEFLRDHRGFDFTGYKRNTLSRRIAKRMQEVGVESHRQYIEFLELRPDEFPKLFNTILINVTSMFRDPESWEHLQTVVLPTILEQRDDDDPIRVWSAGCATGQEAYTLAMVLCEVLGDEAFTRRVKLYATDRDEDALLVARAGVYEDRALEHVPTAMVNRYFESVGSHHRFRTDLRRSLIFGRHDLTVDPPISNLDLLVCRNTLMYFNAETQATVLPRFHYALRDDGVLFLGRAEMLLTHGDLFTPVEMSHRLFRRVPRTGTAVRSGTRRSEQRKPDFSWSTLEGLAFHHGRAAEIVVDVDSVVVAANAAARSTFELSDDDLGRPLRELELSYRPLDLRSRVDQALGDRRPIQVRNVERTFPQGDSQFLDVVFAPLADETGVDGLSISFVDVTRFALLQDEVKRSNQELEGAYEQLQSTNEELETTNEELQSTIEERETTNEELQSTNEELETMNEELQSTNEELETMNVELRMRGDGTDRDRVVLESIIGSIDRSIIAIDARGIVVVWSSLATATWGIQPHEANGRRFADLEFGLPTDELRVAIAAVDTGGSPEVTVEHGAINRLGQSVTTSTVVRPLGNAPHGRGVVLITIAVAV